MIRLRKNRRQAFSLIEVVAAAVLLGVGVAAAVGALGKMTGADIRIGQKEQLSRLAVSKLEELIATEQVATSGSGTFEDVNQPNIDWNLDVTPSGVENLNCLRLTVTAANGDERTPQAEICTLIFTPPANTTGAIQ